MKLIDDTRETCNQKKKSHHVAHMGFCAWWKNDLHHVASVDACRMMRCVWSPGNVSNVSKLFFFLMLAGYNPWRQIGLHHVIRMRSHAPRNVYPNICTPRTQILLHFSCFVHCVWYIEVRVGNELLSEFLKRWMDGKDNHHHVNK